MSDTATTAPSGLKAAVLAALATVEDPELHRPITELGMVAAVEVDDRGDTTITVLLTISGCPLRETIVSRVSEATARVRGVGQVHVVLEVMSEQQRVELRERLGGPSKEHPFGKPGNRTLVYSIASGKGGVGKSSITVNLAAAIAKRGYRVGLVDADVYGHSVPRMLGITRQPTMVEGMLLPPEAHGVTAMSTAMFKPNKNDVVAWRGPMLHRALQQFLTDAYWGDLDVLLLDLPPGTGDIAISSAQLIPTAEIIVVTTPQAGAAEVAERAGRIGLQLRQQVAGVIENMSGFPCPHCGEVVELFGSGGGASVAASLSQAFGTEVPLLGQVPLDPLLREGSDEGVPLVVGHPQRPAAVALTAIAERLAKRARGLVGVPLGLTPAAR